jgi:rhodanese-related sulfurtransferase
MPADDLCRVAAVGAVSAIIDVRPAEAYAAAHIPGSLSIPETKITALVHAVTLRPNAVLVCADGRQSFAVARTLGFSGFLGLYFLDGGLCAWNGAGGALMETTERGQDRPVGKPQAESRFSGLARLFSFRLLFFGLAASAGLVALALRFFL